MNTIQRLRIRTKLFLLVGIFAAIYLTFSTYILFLLQSNNLMDRTAVSIFTLVTVSLLTLTILSVRSIHHHILQPINHLVEESRKSAAGDLTSIITTSRQDEIGLLLMNFNDMITNLKSLVLETKSHASKVASSSEELLQNTFENKRVNSQISEAIEGVAKGSERQMNGAEDSRLSIEEIALGIQRIADTTTVVSSSSSITKEEAEKGYRYILDVIQQMKSIHESTNTTAHTVSSLHSHLVEVENILEFISDISRQTNLLALNAGIEAARAGEQGKGFAVVADEVQKLAEHSGEGVSRISNILAQIGKEAENAFQNIQEEADEVRQGMDLVNETGVLFKNILEFATNSAEQINEVSVASEQLHKNAKDILSTVETSTKISIENSANAQQVAHSIYQQLSATEEISLSAENLSDLAQTLQEFTDKFKT